MIFDVGRVCIKLSVAQNRINDVQVHSERPDVARVLQGRSTEQALKSIPLLFALCSDAQRVAAKLAVAAAHGEVSPSQIDPAVQKEAMREHLWRCLLDLPPLIERPPLQATFVRAVQTLLQNDRAGLFEVLATPEVIALLTILREPKVQPEELGDLLPQLDAATSLSVWPGLTTAFSAQPMWQGRAVQTGAIARTPQCGGYFEAHWLARFHELMQWATQQEIVRGIGSVSAVPVSPNIGRAVVETARGVLMHEVTVRNETIENYVIVAPTEWNFHPQSQWREQLIGQPVTDLEAFLPRIKKLMITLDPCVPYELEWA